MLNKNFTYRGYSKPYRGRNQSPSRRFSRIKILFEDDISFYVESMTEKDQKGFGKRYSVKKHCFHLVARNDKNVSCDECPFLKAATQNGAKTIMDKLINYLNELALKQPL